MLVSPLRTLIALFFVFAPCLLMSRALADEVWYVQAAKATIRTEARLDSPSVTSLTRGDLVSIVVKQEPWFRVKAGKKEGWLSRLFLSPRKPVGVAELAKEAPESLARASRKRSSSYAVSASARGLMASDRGREGREIFVADGEALERMEKYGLPTEKVEAFRAAGGLTEGD